MTQQVQVKRYNQIGQFLYAYRDAVMVNQNAPVYPDLRTQLLVEAWDMRQPSDSKLDVRTVPVLFENKSLTRRR